MPATYEPPGEPIDEDYPMVLSTGRQLEHWHTGSMTRNASVLDAIEPEPIVSIHPLDMQENNIQLDEFVKMESRRGEIVARARPDTGLQRGSVFMAFCYVEAAINLLTVEELDPYGKIPEFKFCAVKIAPTSEITT